MDDLSLRLESVSLCYRLAKQRLPSLKDYAIHLLRGSLTYEKLWALRDIDLTVRRGETLGIIGRNGAGKSTLLKVISRVLKPTKGSARINGRIAPILELGSGFDYELTGLENIYLNALLLGHTRKEIAVKVDEIVEFSGLGDFIRSPLRNYSSGMQARLGFAIATAWVPDILILDEVLSVGDVTFTHRCEERIRAFRESGATVLMVSHATGAIVKNCTRCIWLDDGQMKADGKAAEVVKLYLREHGTEPGEHAGGRVAAPAVP
ncbi:MAG TPA: ABC transporter ATP-binding protein [Thermoanaerobaculia bacterium]|jgi:ABC-type polysaccharide/polyol phosphate transport system ATPase subunit|nr:ABC transporter ATP-binding protein [Thermoanaerobaculia bacterium]